MFEIATTSAMWPSVLAWFVAAAPRTLIICVLPKAGLWAARSAMSLLSHCARETIARFTGTAMKPLGGGQPELTQQQQPVRCGSKRIHWRQLHKWGLSTPRNPRPQGPRPQRSAAARAQNQAMSRTSARLGRHLIKGPRSTPRNCCNRQKGQTHSIGLMQH